MVVAAFGGRPRWTIAPTALVGLESVMDGVDVLLEPPVVATDPSKPMLRTVAEAIDYIDLRLAEDLQNHKLVQAARDALYRAEDTRIRSDAARARAKLVAALRAVGVARG